MTLTRTHTFAIILGLLLCLTTVISFVPQRADALGMEADAMCNPVQTVCGCGMVMGPTGCMGGANMFMCPCSDTTSGFTTKGICVAANKCQAQSTSGKDGFGLEQVQKILGDLMSKLMGQGGGQQPPATPPTSGTPSGTNIPPTCSINSSTVSSNASSTTATISWSSSGDASSASITPGIGSVSPSGSRTVTVSATTPYSMTVTGPGGTNYCSTTVLGFADDGGGQCSGLFAALYGCEDTDDTDTDTDAGTATSLTASPTSGTAPLTVVFSGNAGRNGYTLDYGDGKSNAVGCQSGNCARSAAALSINRSHVYEAAGTYTAKLKKHLYSDEVVCTAEGCDVLASVTIIVAAQPTTNTQTQATTSVPVFTNPAYLIPGLRGDIQIVGPAGTVIVGSRNTTGNTEFAGFYGGNTFSGQATGVVAGICRARPWANNFLAYVLPANFFDGLCIARGYQVGDPPPETETSVIVTQTPPQQIPTEVTTTPSVATSTGPAVPAKVRVWAVPSKVPLGSRASIFWTSEGVTSCLVSSPDGSFSQTTLSGGASTVALTGDTTFTISCLTPDGAPVTDYVTVYLSI